MIISYALHPSSWPSLVAFASTKSTSSIVAYPSPRSTSATKHLHFPSTSIPLLSLKLPHHRQKPKCTSTSVPSQQPIYIPFTLIPPSDRLPSSVLCTITTITFLLLYPSFSTTGLASELNKFLVLHSSCCELPLGSLSLYRKYAHIIKSVAYHRAIASVTVAHSRIDEHRVVSSYSP